MSPNNQKERIKEELNNITSYSLISNSQTIFEKLLWAAIAILGTIFIYIVVSTQLQYWEENPSVTFVQTMNLNDFKLPAVTFCDKGLQKYSVVERLANHIDPKKILPEEFFRIRNIAMLTKAQNNIKESEDPCNSVKDDQTLYVGCEVRF